jgi:hypothetical protein
VSSAKAGTAVTAATSSEKANPTVSSIMLLGAFRMFAEIKASLPRRDARRNLEAQDCGFPCKQQENLQEISPMS